MRQQHQFQTLLQNDQLDKDVKKTLVVMFYTGNANEGPNADKDIININNYLNKENLVQNEDFIDQKDSNIEPVNLNTGESLKNNLQKHTKNNLVQAIIDAKVKKLSKLPSEILIQVRLAMEDLEVKNDKLYIRSKIYILDNKEL